MRTTKEPQGRLEASCNFRIVDFYKYISAHTLD